MTIKAKITSLFGRGQAAVPQFPSIYEHIRSHLVEEGYGLAPGGDELPDDEFVEGEAGFSFVPGGLDGAFARHVGGQENSSVDPKIAKLHSALVSLAERPSVRTRSEVRRLFLEGDARAQVDALISRIADYPPKDKERLYRELRVMLVECGHREVVKYCLALVAAFGDPRDADLFKILGRHEEFTLYAAVALSKLVEDPIPIWLELARHVDGWGRIELAEYLLDGEPRPEVRAFFLREGAQNSIMAEYTAALIAKSCRLHEALDEAVADRALLEGAGVILRALCSEDESGEDMFDYPQGGRATARFLEHLGTRAQNLSDFVQVDRILAFARRKQDAAALRACGWEPERREEIVKRAEAILAMDEWPERALEGLQGDGADQRWLALSVAKSLDLPIRDHLIAAVKKAPLEFGLWSELAQSSDESNIDQVLVLAKSHLDLGPAAAGPDNEAAFCPDLWVQLCLNFIFQELRNFPGKGWGLIGPCLCSTVESYRDMALGTLEAWPASMITPEIKEALKSELKNLNEKQRERVRELLCRSQP